MKKVDLAARIAEKAGISKKAAKAAVDAFMETVTEALGKGEKVTLVGFGSFVVRQRAPRTARNPRTGAPIRVPAKKVPKFVPGAKLRKVVE
ncbi:HU family DNA-binding protein [candidate division WOR-3 bacterium]|nr:HU family DNA-binding protein [candidate division WOR-3 bacterium]